MRPRKHSSLPISAAFAFLSALTPLLAAGESSGTTYRVKPEDSHFQVQVGRAGLFKAFGHDHLIVVERFTGEVDFRPDAPQSSRFSLDVDAASMKVRDDEVSEDDRNKIQGDMESKALALPEHPHILFESTRVEVEKVEGTSFRLKVTGTLSLRGVEKPLTIPLTLSEDGDRLTAKGEVVLHSDAWGVPQIAAVGGAVKTREDLQLSFEIVLEKSGN